MSFRASSFHGNSMSLSSSVALLVWQWPVDVDVNIFKLHGGLVLGPILDLHFNLL